MAIRNFIGFEAGNSEGPSNSSGTFDAGYTTVKRTGSYGLRCNPTTTAIGYVGYQDDRNGASAALNAATIYSRFYFRYATKPGSNSEPIFEAFSQTNVNKFRVHLNSSGNLEAYDSAGTIIGSAGATVLAADTWYRIGVQVGTGASGSFDVRINGVSELSGTANLTTSNNREHRYGKTANINGQSVDFFYDDIAIDDAGFPGAGQVSIMVPDGDGTYTAWTVGAGGGSDWENVDDKPNDGDTTYLLSTGSAGDASSVTLVSSATAGISGTIAATKAVAYCRRNSANGILQMRTRAGSTDSDSGGFNTLAAYGVGTHIRETDPSTSAAWTTSGLDGAEVGVEENDTDASRCTALYLMVSYEPAAGGDAVPVCWSQYRRRMAG